MAGERKHRGHCSGWRVLVLGVLCGCLTSMAGAQAPGGDLSSPQPTSNGLPNILDALHQGAALHLSVLNENKKRLDRQALAKLHCDSPYGTLYQTTGNNSETVFLGLHLCKYQLEISAVGYLSVHKEVEVMGYVDSIQLDIILPRDPMAVSFDATGTADALMSEKASKETHRAIRALQEGSLSGAEKHLQSAYKLAPSSSKVNFLLGYQFFQRQDFGQAEAYLRQATTLDPHNAEAFALLGRVENIRGRLDEARAALERAVAANPDDTLSHVLLGDVYLKQKEYSKAREQAQFALEQSKGDANAQLVLGQAEGNLGHDREAIEALTAFLQAMPTSPQAAQVHNIISELQQHASNPADSKAALESALATTDALVDTSKSKLSINWQPPGIDEAKPSVAADVVCPSDQVIERAGKHAQELVENVGRFAAIEDLLHERLDDSGDPTGRELRKFEYAANVSEASPGFLMIDEYRTQRYGLDDPPDEIVTTGFPALALVFHPTMRVNYEMTCEGLGEWQGQATWLVHFRQREDRPSRIQGFKAGDSTYAVNLKGRAWIAADSFQIVRIESEMVKPMGQIQLLVEHSIAEYAPVHFQKKNLDIWLPKSAEVYLDLRRHRYYRRHSFDHYMLFSVDSEQKAHEANQNPHGPGSTTPRKRKYWPA